MNYKSLFPDAQIDRDKELLFKLEANCIYADSKGRSKTLSMIKMILDRRSDLTSEVYQSFNK